MRPSRDQRGEGLAPHHLHGDEGHAVGLVDLVDDGDPGVGEGGGRASLADEPPEQVGAVGQVGSQDLERNLPAEPGVPGPVDDPHPAAAQLGDDLVVGEPSADHRVA